jgi:hypothetical protein
MPENNWKHRVEDRKFRWMNFGLIGMGASIALLTRVQNLYFIAAMVLFAILVVFEAIGLYIVEKNHPGLGENKWYVRLWFYKATLCDVLFLVIAMLLLGIGIYRTF